MAQFAQRLLLVAHVGTSVGWLGVAVAFVSLGVTALVSAQESVVRSVYVAMQPLAEWVLLPLASVALVIGVVHGLLSPLGLFRHWWVVVKLAITAVWVGFLILYMSTFEQMAARAADASLSIDQIRNASPVLHGAIAAIGLVVALALSILKPRGLTAYGMRTQRSSAG
jgi:hypothetical protein